MKVRVDLRCRSSRCGPPSSWLLRAARASDSYTPPERVYQLAKERGMNLVTLTDRDVIAGALELAARHPDAFVSQEISARFPGGGRLQIVALDIDEAEHRLIEKLRRDAYELVSYLVEQGIAHFWCDPFGPGSEGRADLERGFLLFQALELRSGCGDPAGERELRRLTDQITPARLAGWAERHPDVPWVNRAGTYAFVGGSGDRAGLAVGRAFTAFEGSATPADLAEAIQSGRTEPSGEAGSMPVAAHAAYALAAGHARAREQDVPRSEVTARAHAMFRYAALFGADLRLLDAGALRARGHETELHEEIARASGRAFVRGWRAALRPIADSLVAGRLAEAAERTPALVHAAVAELPRLWAARSTALHRSRAARMGDGLIASGASPTSPRVAVLSDTLDHANGLAIGLRRLAGAAHILGLQLDLVGAGDVEETVVDRDGIAWLPSLFGHRLSFYPEVEWHIPHLPALVSYLVERHVDLVQLSTPGPVGLLGLMAGRLLGLPVIGQFHTDVPAYAAHLTGDPGLGSAVGAAVGWFLRALDHVLVPSPSVVETIARLGVPRERISLVPRGVDLALFSPQRRDPAVKARLGATGRTALLYLGRLSREKNLDRLADAFARLCRERDDVMLALVGEGPMRAELAARLPAGRTVFTGVLSGAALAGVVASCDVMVFPSETDTFGNAVVEAQASGLPVIVSERGAAHERIVAGQTGLRVDARDEAALARAMARLVNDERLRRAMGRAAAAHAQRYALEGAAVGTFREYARLLGELGGRTPVTGARAAIMAGRSGAGRADQPAWSSDALG